MHMPLIAARRRKRLTYDRSCGTVIASFGAAEIWDGDDLVLIRDVLTELISDKGHRSVGIDMRGVKHVPSGFFGMLAAWHDRNVRILLRAPEPVVRHMLWFRTFFSLEADECYRFVSTNDAARGMELCGNASWTEPEHGDDPMERLRAKARVSPIVQQHIVDAYRAGAGSYRRIADRFSVSKAVVGKLVRQ